MKLYNSSNLLLVESRIIPVINKIIDSIIVPEAKMARGTCVIYLVSRNSVITIAPARKEITSRIPEMAEKNNKGL
jgi:hypothetical protein